jgi:hypothetical protein
MMNHPPVHKLMLESSDDASSYASGNKKNISAGSSTGG